MNPRIKALLFVLGWPFVVLFVVMASGYVATREMLSIEFPGWVEELKSAFLFALGGRDK